MTAASVQTPIALLRSNPRFAVFTLVMFPAAIGYGALTQTRTAIAASSFGGAAGIGGVAIVLAVAGAAAAMTSGAVSDRIGPRPIFIGTTVGAALVNLATAGLLASGRLTMPLYLVAVAASAIFGAMNITVLVPLSMGIAAAGSRGAVQIVNMLRTALGVMAGVWIAGAIGRQALVLVAAAIVVPACSLLAAAIAARDPATPSTVATGGQAELASVRIFQVLRTERPLLASFLVLLALDLVVPSQLVAIVLADNDMFERVHHVLLAGLLGVFASRLTLLVTGLRVPIRKAMLTAFSIYTALTVIGAILLARDALLSNSVLLVALVFLGSMTSAFTLELSAALVQQRCPDHVRGRITGTLQAGRTLMTSAGVTLAATVQVTADEAPLVGVLAALASLLLIVTKGFAVIADRSVGTAVPRP